jgi:hypothetical protein
MRRGPALALFLPLALVGAVGLAGCSNLDTTEQRVLSGGAIGAGTGAVVGAMTGGSAVVGGLLGAGGGAGLGWLYDRDQKRN